MTWARKKFDVGQYVQIDMSKVMQRRTQMPSIYKRANAIWPIDNATQRFSTPARIMEYYRYVEKQKNVYILYGNVACFENELVLATIQERFHQGDKVQINFEKVLNRVQYQRYYAQSAPYALSREQTLKRFQSNDHMEICTIVKVWRPEKEPQKVLLKLASESGILKELDSHFWFREIDIMPVNG